MTTIPTEIWAAVGGVDKCVHHACTWASGCHEHINDAIAEHDIEDAKQWVVRRYALAEWQPIKTAPRDGTNILLAWGQDGVSQGKFIPGLPKPWQFIDTNDGITWLINHAVDNEYGPTHWLPMPQWARPTGVAPTSDGCTAHVECLGKRCIYTAPSKPVGVTADAEARYAELLAAYHEACADAARGCTNWQPIVTVPKDGREVILREGSRVGAACWVKWPDTYDNDGAPNADGGEGWTVGYDGDEWRNPTEWQPMPSPAGVGAVRHQTFCTQPPADSSKG